MLDENLPSFFIRPSNSDNSLISSVLLRENGSELRPKYTLRKPDPNLPASRNCYAVALYDSFNPEVLYAQVLVKPEWNRPSDTRVQTGVPPPSFGVVPNSFMIHLYNPDHQIIVSQKAATWNNSACWMYEMPQNSFRVPSSSTIDQSQNPPALDSVTPKIAFKWKRDGKLSKDIACYLVGKNTDAKKRKEPDITVAFFKGKGLTIYEPNMHRVEIEDTKGLEIVLILSAVVIKDIFFNATREMFNIVSSRDISPGSNVKIDISDTTGLNNSTTDVQSSNLQISDFNKLTISSPLDMRTKAEIDMETERLKQIIVEEEILQKKAEAEEERRIKEMLEAEEVEHRRREAEIEIETERLRKEYGVTPPPVPPEPSSPLAENQPTSSKPCKLINRKTLPSGLRVPAVPTWLDATSRHEQKSHGSSPSSSSTNTSTGNSGSGFLTLIQKVQKK